MDSGRSSVILSHYGINFGVGDSNNVLMESLNRHAARRGVTREDGLAIIKAHKAGTYLPPRKPIIRASIFRSTVTQTIIVRPPIAQQDEYSLGASDGNDVTMSDDEEAEEVPSLSDEESDLREYTAAMNTLASK